MSRVSITTFTYKNFGKCVAIENRQIKLLVTTDFGPRIIGCFNKENNSDNLFFEDIDLSVNMTNPEMDSYYGKGKTWYIRGGHRLWVSPEVMPNTYYPDNTPVSWSSTENGAVFRPDEQKENGVRFEFDISIEGNRVYLNQTITNTLNRPKTFAPWSLTVLDSGGTEVIPMSTEDTVFLPNRVISLWPYTDMSDSRIYWGKKFLVLNQDKSKKNSFKIGLNNNKGYAVYINKGSAFILRFKYDKDAIYPDYNVNYETYTNDKFLEMESLGELKEVAGGESVSLNEVWEIKTIASDIPTDPELLGEYIKKIV